MTDEERRILREARENVRLRDLPRASNIHRDDPAPRVREELRREWRRPQPEPPKRERGLDTDPNLGRQAQWDAWNAWVDQKVADAIAAERAFMREAIGGAIAKMLDDEREEQRKALSLEVRELKVLIAELKHVSGGDRRAVLDLTTRAN
jgi:hypothetical protein